MSGGSMDYLCYKVEAVAESLGLDSCHYRRAFSKHLLLVAKALHDIEWVDSCDYGEDDDIPAIKAVLGENVDSLAFGVLIDDARHLIKKLEEMIEKGDG